MATETRDDSYLWESLGLLKTNVIVFLHESLQIFILDERAVQQLSSPWQ